MRSYSIASSPVDSGEIELAIERLEDGEVSPFFHDVVAVGDDVEMRDQSAVTLSFARKMRAQFF